ncbi:hypothetical protein [Nocardia noduli]|uniref:hypothetical protein n=1 Tax=Nocardia noduli TaxID=2815722 RepID=UPI001C227950|nr:hypothetical protein [Nocardia noduli]
MFCGAGRRPRTVWVREFAAARCCRPSTLTAAANRNQTRSAARQAQPLHAAAARCPLLAARCSPTPTADADADADRRRRRRRRPPTPTPTADADADRRRRRRPPTPTPTADADADRRRRPPTPTADTGRRRCEALIRWPRTRTGTLEPQSTSSLSRIEEGETPDDHRDRNRDTRHEGAPKSSYPESDEQREHEGGQFRR